MSKLWRFLFGPRASSTELAALAARLDDLARQLAELPTREELVRQKAAWADFQADYLGLADRIERNLKRLGARMGRAGLNWSEGSDDEASESGGIARKYS